MKLFKCNHCEQPVFFENTVCNRCKSPLGFLPAKGKVIALRTLEDGTLTELDNAASHLRYCQNAQYATCNWLIEANKADTRCVACQLNQTIPNLTDSNHMELWSKLEIAKHRLVYSLLKLKLPLSSKVVDATGLAFDFLSDDDAEKPVIMGHENGIITINLDEADEVKRVSLREKLHEPYRTIVGHFRHEVGHYYWDRLIITSEKSLSEFRTLFGDERASYSDALDKYYEQGPLPSWQNEFISAYATSHPWEDWAETWAHYLHMMDALEIAWSFGLDINPVDINKSEKMNAAFENDPYSVSDFKQLIVLWFPLSIALNSMNRSIGNPDFYPFVVPQPVIDKMEFIHRVCRTAQ